jgi:IS5 family transposase
VSRTAERQVSFGDWELMREGPRLEPLLQANSDFLDTQKDSRVLEESRDRTQRSAAAAILREPVLMRIKNSP